MIVYRVTKTKYAGDLNGLGAKIAGGRWNLPGFECLYASESRALAVLEFTVNTGVHDIPRALSIIAIDLGRAGILSVQESDLPGDWKTYPAPNSTKLFGTAILKAAKTAIIRIPSTIVPNEFNYLLNPLHFNHKDFTILNTHDFIYDLRIKTM